MKGVPVNGLMRPFIILVFDTCMQHVNTNLSVIACNTDFDHMLHKPAQC